MNGEVLAPGGSLDHALWALEGGANAVYVGYQKFSARSHANNLSLDEIACLCAVARERGARVFCAVNVILEGHEIAEAIGLAWQLHFAGVSALIVQDLGFALALRRYGPAIDLHASTQAAVHNSSGVAALKAIGFCRVVMARELTMSELGQIVEDDPKMEYEVFVHGALCYAVSGNCMASGLMIARSANRGDCGQVCRTKFELDYLIPGPKRRDSPHEEGLPEGIHAPPGEVTWKSGSIGAFASMNDLELGARIRELYKLGVQSFKIEGRMKPPAYSYNTARAYRTFLDGGKDKEAWACLDEARLRYGRLPSSGWFDGHKALGQTNPDWAGTLGMPLGPIVAASEKALRLDGGDKAKLFASLGKGDGVMLIGPISGQVLRTALGGPVLTRDGQVEIHLNEKLDFDPRGGSLWLVSRHDGKLPVKKASKSWRHPLVTRLSLQQVQNQAGSQLKLCLSTPDLGGLEMEALLEMQAASGSKRIEDSLEEVLRASDSQFCPAQLEIDNQAGACFVQPKILKEVRRRWYHLLEQKAEDFVASVQAQVAKDAQELLVGDTTVLVTPPARASLSPLLGVNKLVGFVTEWESLKAQDLAQTVWGLSLPLAPFTPNEASYYGRLRDFLNKLQTSEPQVAVFLGLNNPGHLQWVRRLRAEGFVLREWFADWAFHSANAWTPVQLNESLSGLRLVIPWLESQSCADKSYFPPLFTSRACMLRNSFGAQGGPSESTAAPQDHDEDFGSRVWIQAKVSGQAVTRPKQGPRCPAGCAGHFSARLLQGKKQFRVEARDCINYLVQENDEQGSKL